MIEASLERKGAVEAVLQDAGRTAALDILHRRRLGVHELKDVRRLILSDRRTAALTLLIEEYELEWSDANVVLEYLDPAMKGKQLRFEEISPSEIEFADDENVEDEGEAAEDPLEIRVRYFARRGLTVGEAFPTTTVISGDGKHERTDKVFFDREALDPSELHQVWRVVPVHD